MNKKDRSIKRFVAPYGFTSSDFERYEGVALFEAEEEEKAKLILSTLEGLSINLASSLLEKCKFALQQVKLKDFI